MVYPQHAGAGAGLQHCSTPGPGPGPGPQHCCADDCDERHNPAAPSQRRPWRHPAASRLPLLLLLLPLLLVQPTAGRGASKLRPELELRMLRQTVANARPDGNQTGAGGGHHAGNHYEQPGSPQELIDCINNHQPPSNGTFWTGAMRDEPPYFKVVGMWWSKKAADVPMTITTQLSWNRKWQLKAMCRSWGGPIAAVMHMPVLLPRLTKRNDATLSDVSSQILQRAVDKVASFHSRMDRSHPCKLDLMLLAEPYMDAKSLVLYPVNTLRNYARLMARTPLIGLVDVDLTVSSNLRRELLDPSAAARYVAEAAAALTAAAEGRTGPAYSTGASRLEGMPNEMVERLNMTRRANGSRAAYVLPAFATRGGSISAQISRADKLTSLQKNQLRRYYNRAQVLRFDWGSSGHTNTDYGAWFAAKVPYVVEWTKRYEPWVFVDRLTSTWADGRFRGYGKNKISHMRALAYDGYELRVHPNAFIVHRPHEESSSSNAHSRGALYGKKKKTSSMYGHNVHLYNAVQQSMVNGNYTPALHPATSACREQLTWWHQLATVR